MSVKAQQKQVKLDIRLRWRGSMRTAISVMGLLRKRYVANFLQSGEKISKGCQCRIKSKKGVGPDRITRKCGKYRRGSQSSVFFSSRDRYIRLYSRMLWNL